MVGDSGDEGNDELTCVRSDSWLRAISLHDTQARDRQAIKSCVYPFAKLRF